MTLHRDTRRNIPENDNLHCHFCEDLKTKIHASGQQDECPSMISILKNKAKRRKDEDLCFLRCDAVQSAKSLLTFRIDLSSLHCHCRENIKSPRQQKRARGGIDQVRLSSWRLHRHLSFSLWLMWWLLICDSVGVCGNAWCIAPYFSWVPEINYIHSTSGS
jgi:phosphatidylserine/phosphatidylglycerophosphate/cardiolipin synthase-like enzyme